MTYSLTIKFTKNGFTLTQNTDDGISPTWSYQGKTPDKIDEMLTQMRELLFAPPSNSDAEEEVPMSEHHPHDQDLHF